MFKGECKLWKLATSVLGIILAAAIPYICSLRIEKSKVLRPKSYVRILEDSTTNNDGYSTRAQIIIRNIGLTNYENFVFEVKMDSSYEIANFVPDEGSYISELSEKRQSNSRTFWAKLWSNKEISGELIFLSAIPFQKDEKVNIQVIF